MKATISVNETQIQVTVNDLVCFSDSLDHWRNAFCRLLGLNQELLIEFVERSCVNWVNNQHRNTLEILRSTWLDFRPDSQESSGLIRQLSWLEHDVFDATLVTKRIRNQPDYGMAVSDYFQHGWLYNMKTQERHGAANVLYDESYFEGNNSELGYGNYANQTHWRTEKALRQIREISSIRGYLGLKEPKTSGRLLDIGAGYGFFLIAAEAHGWETVGIETSSHAAKIAQRHTRGSVFAGTLDNFQKQSDDVFDVVAMWDLLEHVDDPLMELRIVHKLLDEDGCLFIRTPNLQALEFGVFGADYHSLKLEHLHLFSPTSISQLLTSAGFETRMITSSSHLLRGFKFVDCPSLASTLKGSDLLICATPKNSSATQEKNVAGHRESL